MLNIYISNFFIVFNPSVHHRTDPLGEGQTSKVGTLNVTCSHEVRGGEGDSSSLTPDSGLGIRSILTGP